MNIKSLRMIGFKSFGVDTEISFHDGVNAIVGPNGCGKSNIGDALRWIMGEQNVRHLRGDRIEDIIFSGSRDMKPTGMAEVSMLIEAGQGGMPALYKDFSELEVTRRVYRSGESECLINKKPCLLKDIREIFMDTGLNPRAYSIIEQGSIQDIVNSSPQELRRLIEEAAGITKYRERKAATIRKMEATKENLARLQDIIAEVERQVRAVTRQASEARRYQVFQKELRRMEGALLCLALREYRLQHDELAGRRNLLQEEEDRLRLGLQVAETTNDDLKVRLMEAEQRFNDQQEAHFRLAGRIEVCEQEIRHLGERHQDTINLRERTREELAALAPRIADLAQRRTELAGSLAEARDRIARIEPELEAMREEDRQHEVRFTQGRQTYEAFLRDMEKIAGRKRECLGAISSTEARQEHATTALTARQAEKHDISARKKAHDARIESLAVERASHVSRREEFSAKADDLRREIGAAAAAKSKAASAASELLREITRQESRLEYLKKTRAAGEDLKGGAKQLFKIAASEHAATVLGILGHRLSVTAGYERAIESILASAAETLVVEDAATARALIDRMQSDGRGGCTLSVVPATGATAPAIPLPQGLTAAAGLVTADDRVAPLVRRLLEGCYVAESLDTALDFMAGEQTSRPVVATMDGLVLHPWGGITIHGTADPASVIGTGKEIKSLEKGIAGMRETLAKAEGEVRRLDDLLAAHDRSRGEVQDRIGEIDRIVTALDAEKNHLVHERDALERRAAQIGTQLSQMEAEQERDRQRLAEFRQTLEALAVDESRLVQAVEESRRTAEDHGSTRDDIKRRMSESQVALATEQERHRSLLGLLEATASEIALSEGKSASLEEAIAEFDGRIAGLDQARTKQDELLVELRGGKAVAAGELESAQAIYRDFTDRATSQQESIKKLRGDLDRTVRERSAVDVSVAEYRTRIEETATRATAETGYELDDPGIDEELGEYLSLPADDLREKANRAKSRMAKIGPVNMAAIDELGELRERHGFMTGQRDDLLAALASLQEAIQKINRTSRERFSETYEAVAAKFAETFTVLFNGGEARLELEQNTDVLEAGLHIYAQPPGKKMQKITLLSGGEKAMTAMSLLFAIFAVRPSPFCLMDEVDAPLDDSNVERFIKILSSVTRDSQIALITHNKRTMELADNLVGVTMETPGVSRLIAVQMSGTAPMAG
jgi:chromosome segregation protein